MCCLEPVISLASGAGVVLQSRHAITVRPKRLADEVNAQWIGSYRVREARERKAALSGSAPAVADRPWATVASFTGMGGRCG